MNRKNTHTDRTIVQASRSLALPGILTFLILFPSPSLAGSCRDVKFLAGYSAPTHLWLGPHRNTPESLKPFYEVFGRSIHRPAPGGAPIDTPFGFMTTQGLPFATYPKPPKDGGRTNGPLGYLSTLIVRSDWNGQTLPEDLFALDEPAHLRHFTREEAIRITHQAIEDTYAAYQKLGRADAETIALCRQQDQANAARTTHFFSGFDEHFLGHLQLLSSRAPAEPLNLEEHLGKLPRNPGELWIELGRLNIIDFAQLTQAPSDKLDEGDVRTLVRLNLWQQAYSHLAWDVQPHRVVLQVNTPIRELLLKQGLLAFSSLPSKDHPGEWVLSQTSEDLKRTEENLIRAKLIWSLKTFLQYGHDEAGNELIWDQELRPNERNAWIRLGLIRLDPSLPSESPNQLELFPPDLVQDHWKSHPQPGQTFSSFVVPADRFYQRPSTNIRLSIFAARQVLARLQASQPQ